jgi:hypothetical protein
MTMIQEHTRYTYTKTIDRFKVTIEIDSDFDPSTEGWIEKGSYTSSLEKALQLGYLNTSCGSKQLDIPDRTLYAIEDWAYSVGY